MIKTYFLISTLILLNSCQFFNPNQTSIKEYPDYQIQLKIDPITQEISVKGKLFLPAMLVKNKEIFFYLHKNLQINSFTLNEENCFIIDSSKSDIRFIPEAIKVFLKPKQALSKNKNLEISFSYDGKLEYLSEYAANMINNEWIEIGLYYPWFPYNPNLRPFTYNITTEIDADYKIFGLGKIKNKDKKWSITNSTPTNDIVICASKDVVEFNTIFDNSKLSIFHHNLPDSLIDNMSEDITNITQHYNDWFGKKDQDISIIESKREKGGGYARIGGVFLGGFQPDKYFSNNEGYHRYFAHELAHLWWYKSKSNSWEDWLNESFAEYSALMIIREFFGQEAFDKRLDDKKKEIKSVGPIWGFDRMESKYTQKILYNKGPVLLYELELEIGKENFKNFCKQMASQSIKTTSDFLILLKQLYGFEISTKFKMKLKS